MVLWHNKLPGRILVRVPHPPKSNQTEFEIVLNFQDLVWFEFEFGFLNTIPIIRNLPNEHPYLNAIYSFIFFEQPTNPSNGLLAKFITSGYIRLPNRGNPHLGPKPVNTRSKARQCDEVKPARFNDRTSDRRLLA
ncbi:hypothetical protein Hanom_Chr03g00238971 [Helianthus anomalus]